MIGELLAGLPLAGLLLGAAGSLHCVAMCGPLLIALRVGVGTAARGGEALAGRGVSMERSGAVARSAPLVAPSAMTPLSAMVWHHAGRLAIYGALGALAGFAGQGAALVGWSRALAIVSGGVMLVLAWRRLRVGNSGSGGAPRGALAASLARLPGRLVSRASGHVQRHPRAGRLLLGAINGLLPCGMVYVALTAAVGLGSVPRAVLFMLAFGVGTMPALAIVTIGASRLSTLARGPRWRFAAPVAIALVGLLLIGRGLQSPAPHASHASHGAAAAHPHH